jgi:8-hydroxy-5-deazaflavin:NADPH oxidoreductase
MSTSSQSDPRSSMTLGIIGAGAIGSAFARALARRNIEATIANSRGPESLAALVREIGGGISAGTREQAASADVVLVAVNWSKLPAALAGLPDWKRRIVIDANNAIEPPLFKPADLGGRLSSEVFAGMVPKARVVKAFNHLPAQLLADDPASRGGKRALFYSGDDAPARATVGTLIDRLGFFGVDLGPLAAGGAVTQIPGGPLSVHHFVKLD